MIRKEAQEQAAVFEWAAWASKRTPELNLLYHVPNGGSRNPVEARNLKAQGVKAGVPDLVLPVARGQYHGLYIELKRKGGRPQESQLWWIAHLREQGYAALICYGADDARATIARYLNGEDVLAP